MKKFLMLKTWQILFIMFGASILWLIFPNDKKASTIISMVVLTIGILVLFGWICAIGIELSKILSEKETISTKAFSFHIAYIYLFFGFIIFYSRIFQPYPVIFALAGIYYFVACFVVFRFASMMIASVSAGKLVTGSYYVGYIFLFWFFPIGIWIIQPKIRKLIISNPVAT